MAEFHIMVQSSLSAERAISMAAVDVVLKGFGFDLSVEVRV